MRMNPVYKKELKMMARSLQLPALAVIFNAVLAIVAVIVLYSINQIRLNDGQPPYHSMMSLYMGILSIEVCLLCLFVPSSAGGSIAGERERQTLDILLASGMTIPGIIIGKLLSCISMALLLGISSLPVLAITVMYGGIGLADIYQSVAYVGFLVLMIGCIGVFCSCRFKKTTVASVTTYGIILFLTVGTGLLIPLLNMAFLLGRTGGTLEVNWMIYIWLLNPAVTYITVLFSQMGDIASMEDFLQSFGAIPEVADHWIALSLAVQIVFIAVLIILSVKYLDPQNERFQVGSKMLKK